MEHLLYSSNEMFSSTQLVRQSKKIFDQLVSNEISKAVILRDGKPNFMLLDFKKYEAIMKEFEELKNSSIHNNTNLDTSSNTLNKIKEEKTQKIVEDEVLSDEDKKLKETLKQLEKLELDVDLKEELKEEISTKSSGEIKEFWN
jgi:PHD/YefM family antitoxin component YafN of YafNO toxin-antitoxin module